MTHYPRAPITEALIEIRFGEEIDKGVVEKVRGRLADAYVSVEPWAMRTVQVDVVGVSASLTASTEGYRLNDLDRLNICIVTTQTFTVSRLAPYTRWEDLIERARRDWNDWKRVVGYKRVARIGVRYINRIDVPVIPDVPVELADYLQCHPMVPKFSGFPPIGNYAMQVAMPAGPEGLNVIINSASVPPPILNHMSLVVDIDVSKEGEVPQQDESLWALIARIREYKNSVFEACITDRARRLFS